MRFSVLSFCLKVRALVPFSPLSLPKRLLRNKEHIPDGGKENWDRLKAKKKTFTYAGPLFRAGLVCSFGGGLLFRTSRKELFSTSSVRDGGAWRINK